MCSEGRTKSVCQTVPFTSPDEASDVVFIVEERRLYMNQMMLSLCSPVFKKMLAEPKEEGGSGSDEKKMREIPLANKRYNDMLVFLSQFHPVQAVTPVSDNNLLQLLTLAKEYQAEHVRRKCELYITAQLEILALKSEPHTAYERVQLTNQILLYLRACDQFSLICNHRVTLLEMASSRSTSELRESKHFSHMPAASLRDVYLLRCEKFEYNSLSSDSAQESAS